MQDYSERKGPNTMESRYAKRWIEKYRQISGEGADDDPEIRDVMSGRIRTMTAEELGTLLGLKKTDRYWLIHKNVFKTYTICGVMRIDCESFEIWYAGQVKYKKVNGPPPGERLRKESYDARDISKILGVCEAYAYEIMNRAGVAYILVDHWKRWPKAAFDSWYASQDRYRNKEDREREAELMAASMSMPEMAWILGVSRSTVYSILSAKRNRYDFDIIRLGERKRVMKESFLNWYRSQDEYELQYQSIEDGQAAKAEHDAEAARLQHLPHLKKNTAALPAKKRAQKRAVKRSGNPEYYSVEEVMELLNLQRRTVLKMIREKRIPGTAVAHTYRIPRLELDRMLLLKRERKKEEKDNGNDHRKK